MADTAIPSPRSLLSRILQIQGVYYLLTGVWPLLSIRSFQAITGPKTDLWLVRTVGALVAVIGAVLTWGSEQSQGERQTVALACGSAASLTAVESYYALRHRISAIYLLDAVAEIALIAAALYAWRLRQTTEPS